MNAQTECIRLEARQAVSLQELARMSGLNEADIRELVEYGELSALGDGAAEPTFAADCVVPLRQAARLGRDFDLDLFATGLLLDVIERKAHEAQHVVLPTELVIRESSGVTVKTTR